MKKRKALKCYHVAGKCRIIVKDRTKHPRPNGRYDVEVYARVRELSPPPFHEGFNAYLDWASEFSFVWACIGCAKTIKAATARMAEELPKEKNRIGGFKKWRVINGLTGEVVAQG